MFFSKMVLVILAAVSVCVMASCDLKSMTQKVMYNRARNLHDHGKLEQAIEVYQKVLEFDGDNTEVYYDLGVAYADHHDVNNAKKQAAILRKLGRRDLAEVLETVIRDSSSSRVRKKLQSDFDDQKQKENR
jgi:tetratricopeptide (TPR) repeat protein